MPCSKFVPPTCTALTAAVILSLAHKLSCPCKDWIVSALISQLLSALIVASAANRSLTSMFAVRYGRDVALSVGLVSSTTLLSILTMPPLVGLAMWLFGVAS